MAACPRLFRGVSSVAFGAPRGHFVFFCSGEGGGHLQSLILASTLLIVGFQTIVVGLLGDVISANRKILQDVQYHVRKMDYSRQECEDEKSSDLVKNESGLSE